MLSCFRNAPAWRPTAAFIAGIICHDTISATLLACIAAVAVMLPALSALAASKSPIRASTGKGAMLICLFFATGWAAGTIRQHSVTVIEDKYDTYVCRMAETPLEKGKTLHAEASLLKEDGSRAANVMLYLADDSLHRSLKPGNVIACRTHFSMPPQWHGYRRYLERNGISGTGYVPAGKTGILQRDEMSSPRIMADRYRMRLDSIIASKVTDRDASAVISALILGERNRISDEIEEDFSLTGASHVLSLSGLHLGIIMMIINVLTSPLRKSRTARTAVNAAIVIAMFCYAFFTGMSGSVTRSAIMLSAIRVTDSMGRRSASMNTLFLTAFAMLVYEPYYIYDIGFQLSFTAVFFILAFYPAWKERFFIRNRLLRYFCDLMIISVIAQTGTAPLVAWHFGYFPLYFLPVSIIAIPLVTAIIAVSGAMMAFFFIAPLSQLFAAVAGQLTVMLNEALGFVSSLPHSSITQLAPQASDIILFYLLIAAATAWLQKKSPAGFRHVLIIITAWACINTAGMFMEKDRYGLLFCGDLGQSKCVVLNGMNKTKIPDSTLSSIGQDEILKLNAVSNGKEIKGRTIKAAWLCGGNKLPTEKLIADNRIENIILDNSLSAYARQKSKLAAEKAGIKVYDMYECAEAFIPLK